MAFVEKDSAGRTVISALPVALTVVGMVIAAAVAWGAMGARVADLEREVTGMQSRVRSATESAAVIRSEMGHLWRELGRIADAQEAIAEGLRARN